MDGQGHHHWLCTYIYHLPPLPFPKGSPNNKIAKKHVICASVLLGVVWTFSTSPSPYIEKQNTRAFEPPKSMSKQNDLHANLLSSR